jgi:hypothetical protein
MGSDNKHLWQQTAMMSIGGNGQWRQPAAAEKGIGGDGHQQQRSSLTLQVRGCSEGEKDYSEGEEKVGWLCWNPPRWVPTDKPTTKNSH